MIDLAVVFVLWALGSLFFTLASGIVWFLWKVFRDD